MFRFEAGARILIKRFESLDSEPIEVEILAKAPKMIKVQVLCDGYFAKNSIRWLSSDNWFSIGRSNTVT